MYERLSKIPLVGARLCRQAHTQREEIEIINSANYLTFGKLLVDLQTDPTIATLNPTHPGLAQSHHTRLHIPAQNPIPPCIPPRTSEHALGRVVLGADDKTPALLGTPVHDFDDVDELLLV